MNDRINILLCIVNALFSKKHQFEIGDRVEVIRFNNSFSESIRKFAGIQRMVCCVSGNLVKIKINQHIAVFVPFEDVKKVPMTYKNNDKIEVGDWVKIINPTYYPHLNGLIRSVTILHSDCVVIKDADESFLLNMNEVEFYAHI